MPPKPSALAESHISRPAPPPSRSGVFGLTIAPSAEHPEGDLLDEPAPGTRTEAMCVSLLALLMMLLPVAESLARRFLHRDIPGASLYVQHATLWISFLGAMLATAGGKHLGLSTAHFMAQGRLRSSLEWISALVFAIVTAFLAYGSAFHVSTESAHGGEMLPGGIPVWWSKMIMPVAFGVMSVRVIWRAMAREAGARQRRRHLVLRAASVLLVAAAVYLGWRAGQSERVATWLNKAYVLQRPMLWGGVLMVVVAFLCGTPVFVAMAGVAMVLFFASASSIEIEGGSPVASVPVDVFRLVSNASLPAIPLLTLAGYILAAGNSSQRLVRAYKSLFGWMPGGLAVMAVFSLAIFTTFTGASGVTILALGGLILPMLIANGYREGFSLGLVTASGSLGLLFPPSLPVILYGVTASAPGSVAPVTIQQLFIGGLIPGVLMVLLVCLYGIHKGVLFKAPRQPFRRHEVLSALWEAKWDLLLPLLVIGAFASGIATVVEAAALGCTYALLVELFAYRDVPLRELPEVFVHAASLVGAVVVLLGVALGLTNYLVLQQIPDRIVEWVQLHIHSQWLFLLALNVILLILGSVLEIYSAIVVLVPLVAPLGVAFGVHPVHLGVIFLANLELGFLFPPMGLNLFLSATRFQRPLPTLYRVSVPFLIIMSIGVLLITYVESATTLLLRLVGKY